MRPLSPSETDDEGRAAFALIAPDVVHAVVLPAGTPTRIELPPKTAYVSFSANVDFFAKFGGATVAALWPEASILDGSAAEMNPAIRNVFGATHVSVVSADAGMLTMSFYGV